MMRVNRRAAVVVCAVSGAFAIARSNGAASPVQSTATFETAKPESLWLVAADSGNNARYRVRERLVGRDLPNDAVGTTGAVTGAIIVGKDGKVSPQSSFVVQVTPLKSDEDRRDNYVRNRILETSTYPTVTLVVKSLGNLKLPLPKSGPVSFDLIGELTVHGVTKPSRWHVVGRVDGDQVSGNASTSFMFEDFQLSRPRVPILLSVADTIALEYEFHLVKK